VGLGQRVVTGEPLQAADLTCAHIEDFLVACAQTHAASTTSMIYRAVQQRLPRRRRGDRPLAEGAAVAIRGMPGPPAALPSA
jgi:hypothetical protein